MLKPFFYSNWKKKSGFKDCEVWIQGNLQYTMAYWKSTQLGPRNSCRVANHYVILSIRLSHISHGRKPGGFSHWHGIRICACLLGHLFAKFGIAIGGFHQRRRSPNYINWVYFAQIIVKSTQFDPNWVLFFRKWYTDGWEIWQKIGIVRFSRSGRHIHVRFWWKNPPPPGAASHI